MKKIHMLLLGGLSLFAVVGYASDGAYVDELNPTFHDVDELNPVDHRSGGGKRPVGSYTRSSDAGITTSSTTRSSVVDADKDGDERSLGRDEGVDLSKKAIFKRVAISDKEQVDLSELVQGVAGRILEIVDVGDESLVSFLRSIEGQDSLSATDVGKLYAKMNHLFLDVKDLVHEQEGEGSEERAVKRNKIVQIALKEFGGDAHAMWSGFQESLGSVVEVFNEEIVPHVIPGELGHELTRSITALKDAMSSVGLVSSAVREIFQDLTDEEKSNQKIKNEYEVQRRVIRRKIILRKVLETLIFVIAIGAIIAINLYLPWLFPAIKLAVTVLAVASLLMRCMAVQGSCFQIKSTDDGYAITTTKELTKKMKSHKADKGDENPDENDDDINVSELFNNLYDALGSLG